MAINLKTFIKSKEEIKIHDIIKELPIESKDFGIVCKIEEEKIWAWWGTGVRNALVKMERNPKGEVFDGNGRKIEDAVEWCHRSYIKRAGVVLSDYED